MSPQQRVQEIDRLIDANRAAVISRMHFYPDGYIGWGNAWNRCPDLRAREREFGSLRYDAQQEVYSVEAKEARKAERAERATWRKEAKQPFVKCEHCGSYYRKAVA